MNELTILNYQFHSFGLAVIHSNKELITAKFFDASCALPLVEGKPNQLTHEIIYQLDAYATNPQFKFDLPLAIKGTKHQCKVWQIMLQIKSGNVLTYGEAAKLLGSAPRAIGGACGKNPLPVFIPCHRIIAANFKLGGFNSGNTFFYLGIKKWLLAHEGISL